MSDINQLAYKVEADSSNAIAPVNYSHSDGSVFLTQAIFVFVAIFIKLG